MQIEPKTKFDIFLACPMSAYSGDEYRKNRDKILELVKAIRLRDVDSRIFCPAMEINDLQSWDLPQEALEQDMAALERSELFVMTYTRPVPIKVSSVVVEAGMALAKRIPSIIVVNDRNDLPYLLRSADQLSSASLRQKTPAFASFDSFLVKIVEIDEGKDYASLVDQEIETMLRRAKAKV